MWPITHARMCSRLSKRGGERVKLLVSCFEVFLCSSTVPAEPGGCTDGDVRLIGRASDSEGVVEVCLDNIYHRTDTFDWRIQEATVVCKQLGFEGEFA